jgi:hypothetical protein
MGSDRPAIPANVKRTVRQRCGFGCVVCGNPIVEYDHLYGWAETGRHLAEELTLLCPRHHSEKTRGLLPAAEIEKANGRPANLRQAWSAPSELHFGASRVIFDVATVRFRSSTAKTFIALKVDSSTLLGFRFENGVCLVKVKIFDTAGKIVLEIVDNELVFTTAAWDVEFVANRLKIRAGVGRIVLGLVFDVAQHKIAITHLDMKLNGVRVAIIGDLLSVGDFSLAQLTLDAGEVAVTAGDVPACQQKGLHVARPHRDSR